MSFHSMAHPLTSVLSLPSGQKNPMLFRRDYHLGSASQTYLISWRIYNRDTQLLCPTRIYDLLAEWNYFDSYCIVVARLGFCLISCYYSLVSDNCSKNKVMNLRTPTFIPISCKYITFYSKLLLYCWCSSLPPELTSFVIEFL